MKLGTKSVSILILAVFLTLALPMQANAATPEQIKASVENGTAWLAARQNPDGSWGTYPWGWYPAVGITGLAVLKLETHATEMGLSPLDPAYVYQPQVKKGLNFLLSRACFLNTSEFGVGVYFTNGSSWQPGCSDTQERTYQASIAMMAIAASKSPTTTVNVPGSPVNGWTYKDVLNASMNYMAAGQMVSSPYTGGWNYADRQSAGWNWADNSNTGWATLGIGYMNAPPFNVPIPVKLKNNLSIWIDYIQTDVNTPWCDNSGGPSWDCIGGSGYGNPGNWVNILKTGHLLYEMLLVGDNTSTQRVKDAVNYIDRHFNDTNCDPGWRKCTWGGSSNYHATYTMMKGLTPFDIVTLPNGTDWFDKVSSAIVSEQNLNATNTSGSWSGCYWGYWGDELCTSWALLTLEKAIPAPPAMPGNATGGGWIASPIKPQMKKNDKAPANNKATFGFVAHYADGATKPSGNLQYTDHVSGMNVHGNVTMLSVDKTTMTATFKGIAKVDGMDGIAYEVTVVDNGEPGKTDTFAIYIPAMHYLASDTLGGGNIQIHDP